MLCLFDKDGTLVETKSGKPFPKLGDQRLIPGVKERISALALTGSIIAVTSNQAGIEKGYKSLEDAIAEFQELMQLLPEVSACYFCPNFSGSKCFYVNKEGRVVAVHEQWKKYSDLIGRFRKPNPGMLLLAIEHELWTSMLGQRKPNKDVACYTGDRPEDERAAYLADVPYQHVTDWLLDHNMTHGGDWNYQILVTTPEYVRVKTYVYALNQIEAIDFAKRNASALLNSGQELEDLSEWKTEFLKMP